MAKALTGLSGVISASAPTCKGTASLIATSQAGGASMDKVVQGHILSEEPQVAVVAGAATFFLACGFTHAVQLDASPTGWPIRARATMATFAVGLPPALFAITSESGNH
jgi:sulfite exporter TauE/SafE